MIAILRVVSIGAGLGILAAATWAVITDARLDGPHAAVVATMALGTAAGALVLARSSWRVGLAVALAVLTGEMFGMLSTAERIIKHREAAALEEAQRNPAHAEARTALDRARSAVTAHDAKAAEQIAKKDCATNCRALLDSTRVRLVADRDDARAALAALAGDRSTPLADRLGVQPWVLDLIMAGLLSLGANGLACILIAWGAHATKPEPRIEIAPPVPVMAEPIEAPANVVALVRKANGKDAAKFALECLKPSSGGAVPLKVVAEAYWQWCDRQQIGRPDTPTTVNQMVALFQKASIETEMTGREVIARGVALTG